MKNDELWKKLEAIHSDVQEMKIETAAAHATFKANLSNLQNDVDKHSNEDSTIQGDLTKRVTSLEKGSANLDGKLFFIFVIGGAIVAGAVKFLGF